MCFARASARYPPLISFGSTRSDGLPRGFERELGLSSNRANYFISIHSFLFLSVIFLNTGAVNRVRLRVRLVQVDEFAQSIITVYRLKKLDEISRGV